MNFNEIANLVPGGDNLLPQDMGWGMQTLWSIIDWFQSIFLNGLMLIFDFMYGGIEQISNVSLYLDNPEVIFNGIADVASLFLVILFLKQVLTNYILDLDGDSDVDPIQAMVNIAVALAVVNCSGEIHEILMKVCDLFAEYLSSLVLGETYKSVNLTTLEGVSQLFQAIIWPFTAWGVVIMLIAPIWVITVFILLLVIAVKILFRGVELFLFQCLMPLFACDLITQGKELWKPFLRSYLVTIFGYLIQFICMELSIVLIFDVEPGAAESLFQPLIGTVMLFFACKAPKWLSSFTYQTGAGQSATAGARSVMGTVSQAMSAIRYIK